ncbi:fimbrial protein FimV [Acinetobacter sp. ANC 3813]|uniref:fimbrial protein FimV n=1 Tax=Acinetobacter sp. ANC 3813 TaxID=1977873 RepID=UPI000A351857|nr:fimbrial protein FimV [Acinetobacter sp. ANC 3813]OTG90064.1 fimbrial protein FimV [Acinetobacter sp. ANC 3813]
MLYVIPFVILLIVLVVLKKRQDAQGSEKSTATTATQKGKAKKASSSAKVAPNKTQAVENAVIEKKQTSSVTAETRQKIEALIQERNFFSAEAQINQALKKDNSQHELYLYLLDIHILQKDEFAISQLLNHVRSLELDDILDQAEAKKTEYDQSQNKTEEITSHVSPITHNENAAAPKIQNTADFDALMASPAAESKNDLTFKKVQPKTAEADKPLEFNLSFDTAPKAQPETSVPDSAPSVDFSQVSAKENASEASANNLHSQPTTDEIKPLEFNLSFDSVPKAKPEVPVLDAAPSVDFGSFSVEETAPEVKIESEATPQPAPAADEIKPLDFSLNLDSVAQAEPAAEEIKPLDFSFSLDTPPAAEVKSEAAPALNFDLGSLDTPAAQAPAEEIPAAPISSGVSFDLTNVSAPAAMPADSSDPLVQSFPELAESNEITVNIELAQQYIKLGAFAAARELLTEREAEYSTEQRQQADLLLNQIAS